MEHSIASKIRGFGPYIPRKVASSRGEQDRWKIVMQASDRVSVSLPLGAGKKNDERGLCGRGFLRSFTGLSPEITKGPANTVKRPRGKKERKLPARLSMGSRNGSLRYPRPKLSSLQRPLFFSFQANGKFSPRFTLSSTPLKNDKPTSRFEALVCEDIAS